MYTEFSERERQLRRDLRMFLDEHLPSNWVGVWQDEEAVVESARVTEAMSKRGWLTYYWPSEYGGLNGTIWDQVVIQEELFAHHEPRGSQYMGVNWIGPVVMRYGSEAQKAEILPEIAEGRGFWAQLFSEPDAGTDLASLRTTALSHGDDFLVNGEKIWTSYANTAERGFLLARTDLAAERHSGLSVLLIDMATPGISVREIPSAIGWHRFHSVHFDNVVVPRSALLGELNQGWSIAMAALPFERIGNARYARTTRVLGLLERHSHQSGEPGDQRVAKAIALGRMAELLNHRAAFLKERDENFAWQASAAFACNALYEQEVAALAEQQLGFSAFVASPDLNARFAGEVESFVVRQAPTVTIQAGTYQVQLSVIGRQAMGFPRAS